MREEIVTLLSDLVAIDSVNPDLVPGGAGEAAIAEYLVNWAHAADMEVSLEEVAPGRPNVIITARGRGGGKTLMLNAHTDTVGAGGMTHPFTPRIEGDRLYGRGAYDMKSGLVTALLTAKAVQDQKLRGDVIVTAVVDEEYASIGTEAVAATLKADAAIVTEPTDLTVCVAHKGFAWFDIITTGFAAHGSLPEIGVDAIAHMGPILSGITALDQRLRASRTHPFVGPGSLHASMISGGQELSSYPARCVVRCERRTIPGETEAEIQEQIHQLVAGAKDSNPALVARVEFGLTRDPFEIAIDAPLVQLLSSEFQAVVGQTPVYEGGAGWMDSALLSAAGIPTVIFGPGGEGAHADEEWANLADIEKCTTILTNVATRFCQ